MTMDYEIERMMAANARYADRFVAGLRPLRPRRRLVVVACMDSRMDVFAMLGLEIGDAHVIRNAGGIVTDDVIRSIALSQRALGTEGIVLVHHTNCGLEGVSDADFASRLEREVGEAPEWTVGGFDDVYEDVRESIARLERSPFLLHREVAGFVYDVDTGLLDPVSRSV